MKLCQDLIYNLLVSYGLDSKITSTNTTDNNLASWNSGSIQSTTLPNGFVATPGIGTNYDLTKGQFNIALNPLFFVRSGYVNKGKTWGQGNIAGNGDEGHILSGDHYRLFYTSHVNPSHIDLVYSWGHPLRCLAIE